MNSSNGPGNAIGELHLYWSNDSTIKNLDEIGNWYKLDCCVTDLTFDGENIWICDYTNKKIKKNSF